MKEKIFEQCLDMITSIELVKEIERLIKSGGTPLKNEIEAKAIVYVAMLNEAEQYRPLSKEAMKIAENLKHF